MRWCVLLAILSLSEAGPSVAEKGQCIVDSGEAISDMMDAALFLWAASKRCGNKGEEAKCVVDISSGIKSINSMANVIAKVLDDCDALHFEHKKCAMSAGKMTKHAFGLTAAGGEMAGKCPGIGPNHTLNMGALASPIQCTVDLKNTAKSLFKAIKNVLRLKGACDASTKHCAISALDVAGAVGGVGEYLAGAIGQCHRSMMKSDSTHNARPELCADGAFSLVHHASDLAASGLRVSEECGSASTSVARLYTESDAEPKKKKDDKFTTNAMLGALLPVVAVVGFIGGRIFGSQRQTWSQARQFESDIE